jgi:hypothetical protein
VRSLAVVAAPQSQSTRTHRRVGARDPSGVTVKRERYTTDTTIESVSRSATHTIPSPNQDRNGSRCFAPSADRMRRR